MPWQYVTENTPNPYYWNSETNETSWTAPQEQKSAWQKVTDENTGREYYWNAATGEVKWTNPEEASAPAPAPTPAATSSSSSMQPAVLAERLLKMAAATLPPQSDAAPPPLANATPVSSPPGLPPLPAGWSVMRDAASTRLFYGHSSSGRTSWSHPAMAPASEPLSEPAPLQSLPQAVPQRPPAVGEMVDVQQPQYAGAGPGYSKAVKLPQQIPRPAPYHRPGRGRGRSGRKGQRAYDPLDPSSWEEYEVPEGGWSKGLAQSQGQPARAPQPSAAAPPRPEGKALPSPGEILRMNAAAKGGPPPGPPP